MTTKTTFFLLGAFVGAAIPLIVKAARPLATHALAGGMLAYEVACDAIESSQEVYSATIKRVRHDRRKGTEV